MIPVQVNTQTLSGGAALLCWRSAQNGETAAHLFGAKFIFILTAQAILFVIAAVSKMKRESGANQRSEHICPYT